MKALKKAYADGKPVATLNDPITIAHFVKELSSLRSRLERFVRDISEDEAVFLRRFNELTAGPDAEYVARFEPVEWQGTVSETIQAFVRRNPGDEFTTPDIARACGFINPGQVGTIRTTLSRLCEERILERVQRGVDKSAVRSAR